MAKIVIIKTKAAKIILTKVLFVGLNFYPIFCK